MLALGKREMVDGVLARPILGAGVAKALLGKTVLDDDLPFVTGQIGLLGTGPCYEMMRDCDTLSPAYVFLASPHCSSYITGEILPMIGGYSGG